MVGEREIIMLYESFKIDKRILELSETALKNVEGVFAKIDSVTEYNQQKMLNAFIENNVSEADLGETTG